MDAQQFKHVLKSTAAGTLLLLSADIVIAEHLIQYEPDRPQVSAATTPIWGYNRPCWRRFPQTPPCDTCLSGAFNNGEYVPSQFPSQSPAITPSTNKPISVLPGSSPGQPAQLQGQPALSPVQPALSPGQEPMQNPMQPPAGQFVPPTGRPLPPLPGPPTSITPIPDAGPVPQQSRYTQPSLWLPSNGMNGSRYGQVPVSTISSSAITGSTSVTPSGLIIPASAPVHRFPSAERSRYAQPGR